MGNKNVQAGFQRVDYTTVGVGECISSLLFSRLFVGKKRGAIMCMLVVVT